jgi:membrane-bound lytic murein transglycosylase B
MMSRQRKVVLSLIVVLLAIGLVTGVALAATSGAGAATKGGSTCVGCPSGGCPIATNCQSVQADVAKALGISVEDFQKELAAGKTCAQIAQEKGISTQQLAQATAKIRSDLLDKAVASGTLSQDQAKFMKDRIAQCAGSWCTSGGPAGGCGACGR